MSDISFLMNSVVAEKSVATIIIAPVIYLNSEKNRKRKIIIMSEEKKDRKAGSKRKRHLLFLQVYKMLGDRFVIAEKIC